MTVVVGPPGSGRSTFLRHISGRLLGVKGLKINGVVKYNGYTANEFELGSSIAFVDQVCVCLRTQISFLFWHKDELDVKP
jgi:ABC-type hemin transport system ATPase subunit